MNWLCIKDVIMDNDNTIAFTKGRVYTGQVSATPGGQKCIGFTNDQNEDHLTYGKHLHTHFIRICPECEQSNVTFTADEYLCDNCVLNNQEMG